MVGMQGAGRGGERWQSPAGRLWSPVSLVRAPGLHSQAYGDPGKKNHPGCAVEEGPEA